MDKLFERIMSRLSAMPGINPGTADLVIRATLDEASNTDIAELDLNDKKAVALRITQLELRAAELRIALDSALDTIDGYVRMIERRTAHVDNLERPSRLADL